MFTKVPRAIVDAAGLTKEQRFFIKTVVLRGANALLCAAAGTGKSTCIRVLRQYADLNGVRAAWTASTGVASCALHGTSVYSWAGLGRPRGTAEERAAYLRAVTRLDSHAGARLRSTHLLVVDEVSMLPPYVLEWIDSAARAVREEPARPFGGMQVVFVGDFLQLQPVRAEGEHDCVPLYAAPIVSRAQLVPCVLTRLLRQDADDDLTRILQYVRHGAPLPQGLRDALLARVTQPSQVPPDATWIVSTRAAAHRVCSHKAWTHRDALAAARGKAVPLTLLQPAVYMTQLPQSLGAPRGAKQRSAASGGVTVRTDKASRATTLVLPGTPMALGLGVPSEPVAARRTLQDAPSAWAAGVPPATFARSVVDGLAGHVFAGMRVVVLVNVRAEGRIVCANGQCGEWVGVSRGHAQVRLQGTDAIVNVPPTVRSWTSPACRDTALHAAWWPVLPAYALTVHRVQGSTLPRVAVELSSDMFAPQQAYVALSRARRLADVYVLPDVDLSCLQLCDDAAVRWYALLQRLVERRTDELGAKQRARGVKRPRTAPDAE